MDLLTPRDPQQRTTTTHTDAVHQGSSWRSSISVSDHQRLLDVT